MMEQFTPQMGAWIVLVALVGLCVYLWWTSRVRAYRVVEHPSSPVPVCHLHGEGNFFGSCEECLRLVYGDPTTSFKFLKPCPACRSVAPHDFWIMNEGAPRLVVDRRCGACGYVWTEK
jgi:hypothetical protein